MAIASVRLSVNTAERLIRQTRRGEAAPTSQVGREVHVGEHIRHWRQFELTEELSGGAGATAAVKWLQWDNENQELDDSGETGEVMDLYGVAWGLEGERGEARFLGGNWIVATNPGQPFYQGTLAGDVTAAGNTNCSVTIDGNTRTVSAYMPEAPGTGKKWASGSVVFLGHTRGAWRIVSIVGCPVVS